MMREHKKNVESLPILKVFCLTRLYTHTENLPDKNCKDFISQG